jgi:hypothetical protein
VNEWNTKAVEITSFTRQEVLGRDLVQEFITEEYRESCSAGQGDSQLRVCSLHQGQATRRRAPQRYHPHQSRRKVRQSGENGNLCACVTTLEKTVIDNRSENERKMKWLLDKLDEYVMTPREPAPFSQ